MAIHAAIQIGVLSRRGDCHQWYPWGLLRSWTKHDSNSS
jgi:hypothetical protein